MTLIEFIHYDETYMTAPPKRKLCWNCEGNVSLQEENCPFCGVYLSPSDEDISDEGIEDLFSPPYQSYEEEQQIPSSPYQFEEEKKEEAAVHSSEVAATPVEGVKSVVMPLTLLLSGTVFFLFGIALFLFSRGGYFILRWNGAYWHLYLFAGLAALIFGWKSLNSLVDSDE